MIQMQTKLVVADNSGAKVARCIKILGGAGHMITGVGDVIIVSIIEVSPGSKIEKGKVFRGVIVRTKSKIVRVDGSFVKFDDNAVILLDKEQEPIATRIFGPIAREIKQKKFLKIVSLASEVI